MVTHGATDGKTIIIRLNQFDIPTCEQLAIFAQVDNLPVEGVVIKISRQLGGGSEGADFGILSHLVTRHVLADGTAAKPRLACQQGISGLRPYRLGHRRQR